MCRNGPRYYGNWKACYPEYSFLHYVDIRFSKMPPHLPSPNPNLVVFLPWYMAGPYYTEKKKRKEKQVFNFLNFFYNIW